MISKQILSRFVVNAKVGALESAIVLMTDDKKFSFCMEGKRTQLAAVLAYVAREQPELKEVLVAAVADLGEDGREEEK